MENGTENKKMLNLENLLKTDGQQLAGSLMDFLADAFVYISDGAPCSEWHKITDNLEIFVTIKRRR